MPSPRTKPGIRKLSDVARLVVVPEGIVSTGYPAVRDKCRDLGIVHDDWQQGLGRLSLGKRRDGKYAATVGGVVLSIPRQVGKTFTVGTIIFALCLLFPGLTVIWTAHRTRTSNETFRAMQGLARRLKVAPHVLAVRRTNGEQEIEFRNGSRIMFGAREQGFGRGFAEVDVIVFDEAQILTERALEDMVAATNQSHQPAGALLFYMGTPPRPVDPGEAFTNKRKKARSGLSKDMVYVEFGADPGADPDDRGQWLKANPSFPVRTPVESMLRLRENVGSDESFLREGLGVWDDPDLEGVLSLAGWRAAESPAAAMAEVRAFSIEVSFDRAWTSIAAAGPDADGVMVVEVVDRRRGTAWVADRCLELTKHSTSAAFVVDSGGPGSSLIGPLESARVNLLIATTRDVGAACAGLVDAVAAGALRHGPQPDLDAAVAGARKRTLGDGAFAFGRKVSTADIDPLMAVSLALWAARENQAPQVWSIRELMEQIVAEREAEGAQQDGAG